MIGLSSKILSAFALLLLAAAAARAEGLPRGEVVAKVVAASDPSHSYALYLPASYTPAKKWPILYAFDPVARGAVPVERYKAAAERFGWIVVGSNNSRNGPMQASLEAARVLWDDTHARFSVDERRHYATGFSGGARVATSLGLVCEGCFAGVVAHGAGFNPRADLTKRPPFAFFGAVGRDDYNFLELVRLDETLAKLDATRRVVTFDGAHQWATPEVCEESVAWMELQAMRAGARARDDALVSELWSKELARARAAEASGDLYAALRRFRSAAEGFAGLRDVAEAESHATRLAATKEARRGREDERGEIDKQEDYAGRIRLLAASRRSPRVVEDESFAPSISNTTFNELVSMLRKQAAQERDTSERRVARRTLGATFAQFYEAAERLRREGREPADAVHYMQVAAELAPDNPHVLFELAAAYAANRQKRQAVETLARAVERGFSDAERLAAEKSFDAMRSAEDFRRVAARVGAKR
ncbi:MAG TPA: tetratricopeptide repeat protein [Pyrinomonadaceae bacterium]|nr:tetratricopeptide repeat protein [Pyrinomonadaceae bacterium]